MVWGGPGVPGPFGYGIPLVFAKINKQIQFSQVTMVATNPQHIITNMVWGTRGPGPLGITIFLLLLPNDKQTNPIFPNDNLGHKTPTYSNQYGFGRPGVQELSGYAIPRALSMVNKRIKLPQMMTQTTTTLTYNN